MKIKHEQKHYLEFKIKDKEHLVLNDGEQILGKFMRKVKTKWRAWGSSNRNTDHLVITNQRVIYIYLLKSTYPRSSSTYVVDKIPIRLIQDVSFVERPKKKHELKISYLDENKKKWSYNIELYDETSSAISLINSQISKN